MFLINYLKNAKLALSKHLCGTPLTYTDGRVGLDCNGLPKVFPVAMRKLIVKRDGKVIILAYTLLSISRLIPVRGVPKLSTITEPFTGNVFECMEFNKFLTTRFVPFARRAFGVEILQEPKLLASTKSGPTGAPALIGVFLDIINLFKVSNTDVLTNIENWVNAVPSTQGFYAKVKSMASLLQGMQIPNFPTSLSKLLELPDKEGKVRIIAIVDGISQALLFPVHVVIFSLLRKIPNDFTHNQREAIAYIHDRSQKLRNSGVIPHFFCYDLSAATDRLPLFVQAPVIGGLLGDVTLGELWSKLISDRNFDYYGKPVRYEVGQPMGAYSSFAGLAITHHAIMQYAFWKLKRKGWCKDYAIVGDDIVIVDPRLAELYVEIMDHLGVPINKLKSFASEEFFEFCKRYNYKGIDVSPLPISLLLRSNVNSVVSFWNECSNRGFDLLLSQMPLKVQKVLEFPSPASGSSAIAYWMYKYTSICESVHPKGQVTRKFLEVFLTMAYQQIDLSERHFMSVELTNIPRRFSWVQSMFNAYPEMLQFVHEVKVKALESELKGAGQVKTAWILYQNGILDEKWIAFYLNTLTRHESFTSFDIKPEILETADLRSVVDNFENLMSHGLEQEPFEDPLDRRLMYDT